MIPIVTAEQMRTLDRRTITEAQVPGLTLMERAGTGVVAHLEQRYGSRPEKW
ncbi:MAG: NAD(P)H-hydrate epimerase [Nitrospira sp. OLB3]|nr:MAG: NAD(P)H-hydrate epimerase [Nitrospira sp. OLB3]